MKARRDTDLAILEEAPPDLVLTMPESLVYQAWMAWKESGRYWDSDQPPETWDAGLRENVRDYDFYWRYTTAHLKQEE